MDVLAEGKAAAPPGAFRPAGDMSAVMRAVAADS